jgi:D-lactate dehydrogenase (cytochrome)
VITKRTRFAELAQQLPPGRLLEDPVALLTYERDASIEHGLPDAVVFPRSAAEVAQIARWAAQTGTPLIARGAGTGLSGGAVPEHGGLIVQFSHLDRLRELDAAGRSALVEPGLINLTLDSAAKALGLYYPPDPASGRASTLGGNLAENAGGPHCFKYGVTSNYVTGLEVVLADGRLVQLGGRALDYPEYDLCALLVGSEGTLGLITAASVRLLRNPPALKTMMAAFDSV